MPARSSQIPKSEEPVGEWCGRGRLPRWLQPQLRGGRQLDDFLIERASVQKCETN
ncbi:H-NS family nucleoid-associated regulatory protein [Bradyrhizobium sp. CCBAU 11445]|uniref:H-NS family nucleoid-associated regulatory protein n=1 Tax=Bradyrhizobium sp. CCBAU 11445 TaxID=1630896 RepID=UPI003FA47770